MDPQVFKIFFFGDSICFGQGVSLHRGWVPRLAHFLSEKFDGRQLETLVINSSINGSTTRQALERMPYDIQTHRPDLLIVQYGMNDCNYWQTDGGLPRVSPGGFQANLNEILERAFTFGTSKVILNTNHPTARRQEAMTNTHLTYEDSNRQYNQLIREVGVQWDERVVLNDMENIFLQYMKERDETLKDLLLPDQLHLSEEGHDLYFSSLQPLVSEVVENLCLCS